MGLWHNPQSHKTVPYPIHFDTLLLKINQINYHVLLCLNFERRIVTEISSAFLPEMKHLQQNKNGSVHTKNIMRRQTLSKG